MAKLALISLILHLLVGAGVFLSWEYSLPPQQDIPEIVVTAKRLPPA
jgi:hypothetical protein